MGIPATHAAAGSDGSMSSSDTANDTSNKIELAGRLGYAAKGVIYVIVGVLASQAAFTSGGQTTGSRGAIREIANQPFGRILLGLMALGLLGYAIWRFAQAIKDPDGNGTDTKGLIKRFGYGVSGVVNGLLASMAGSIALGLGTSQGGGDSKADWTARLLSMPFGQWLVGGIGAAIVVYGLYSLKKAITAEFMEKYRDLSGTKRKIGRAVGRTGLAARCVTFCIIGMFLMIAAYRYQPEKTKGLSGALQTLAEQPYGPWLLGVVALGVIAYGVHCFVNSRYRRFGL